MQQQKLGRYELLRVLGKGAMGLVYEGHDPNLQRQVAIKTIQVDNLSPEEAAEYEVRFRTEARSAARLQHPNIVSVYDSDRDQTVAYLVMEFVHGQDLKHHLDQGKRYTLAQTVAILHDLLSALDYAHRQNVVHRDVKPANLLVQADGRIKLTDFGVARIQDTAEATRTRGAMVGTLKYMAPEQVQGLAVDARCDLFAAGVVLYQLLTGTRPFNGSNDYEIIQQILTFPPEPPSVFNPGLPPEIDAVVARALAKPRAERFQSAHEFDAALAAAVQHAADTAVLPPADPNPSLARSQSSWAATKVSTQSGSTVVQEAELVYWKEIKDSTELEHFEHFLRQFPAGTYAELAKRRIKRLSGDGSDHTNASASDPTVRVRPAEPTVVLAPGQRSNSPTPHHQPPPAPRRAWLALGTTGLALAAGVAYLAARGPQPLAQPEPQPMASAPVVSAPAAIAPVAQPPSKPASVPVAVASSPASMPVSSPVSSPVGAAVAVKPKPSAPSPAIAKKPHALASAPDKPATSVVQPKQESRAGSAEAPAASQHADPRQECEGLGFFRFHWCMRTQCQKPQYAQTRACVEHRAKEQRSLEAAPGLR